METLVEYIGASVARPILGRVCRIHGRELARALRVYVGPGHHNATTLRSWGSAHRELWKARRGES